MATSSTDRIEKRVELKAPVSRVWRALTDATEFGSWFGVKLTGAFEVGRATVGRFTHPDYAHLTWKVQVVELDAERHRFAFLWHPYAVDAAVDYEAEVPTRVQFTLEAIDGGTRLTVVESGFDQVPLARRAEAFRMNEGGWAAQVENVRAHVDR